MSYAYSVGKKGGIFAYEYTTPQEQDIVKQKFNEFQREQGGIQSSYWGSGTGPAAEKFYKKISGVAELEAEAVEEALPYTYKGEKYATEQEVQEAIRSKTVKSITASGIPVEEKYTVSGKEVPRSEYLATKGVAAGIAKETWQTQKVKKAVPSPTLVLSYPESISREEALPILREQYSKLITPVETKSGARKEKPRDVSMQLIPVETKKEELAPTSTKDKLGMAFIESMPLSIMGGYTQAERLKRFDPYLVKLQDKLKKEPSERVSNILSIVPGPYKKMYESKVARSYFLEGIDMARFFTTKPYTAGATTAGFMLAPTKISTSLFLGTLGYGEKKLISSLKAKEITKEEFIGRSLFLGTLASSPLLIKLKSKQTKYSTPKTTAEAIKLSEEPGLIRAEVKARTDIPFKKKGLFFTKKGVVSTESLIDVELRPSDIIDPKTLKNIQSTKFKYAAISKLKSKRIKTLGVGETRKAAIPKVQVVVKKGIPEYILKEIPDIYLSKVKAGSIIGKKGSFYSENIWLDKKVAIKSEALYISKTPPTRKIKRPKQREFESPPYTPKYKYASKGTFVTISKYVGLQKGLMKEINFLGALKEKTTYIPIKLLKGKLTFFELVPKTRRVKVSKADKVFLDIKIESVKPSKVSTAEPKISEPPQIYKMEQKDYTDISSSLKSASDSVSLQIQKSLKRSELTKGLTLPSLTATNNLFQEQKNVLLSSDIILHKSTLKTRLDIGIKESIISSSGLKSIQIQPQPIKLKTGLAEGIKLDSSLIQKQVGLIGIPSITPPTPPPSPPPIIPLDWTFKFKEDTSMRKSFPAKMKYKYQPSVGAIIFGVTAKKKPKGIWAFQPIRPFIISSKKKKKVFL